LDWESAPRNACTYTEQHNTKNVDYMASDTYIAKTIKYKNFITIYRKKTE